MHLEMRAAAGYRVQDYLGLGAFIPAPPKFSAPPPPGLGHRTPSLSQVDVASFAGRKNDPVADDVIVLGFQAAVGIVVRRKTRREMPATRRPLQIMSCDDVQLVLYIQSAERVLRQFRRLLVRAVVDRAIQSRSV